MKFNIKSRKGFTLIELLVVIGILAVLAAIAIPSVAGLIDRANVSADNTNANEYTNAIERFASEYELYCQDIASGIIKDENGDGKPDGDLDSAQGRVFNVTGVVSREDITNLESNGHLNSKISRDTKYPLNTYTLEAIIQNYTKTSSATFEPKQSDCSYWYNPDCGIVVVADTNASIAQLNDLVVSGKDAKGNELDDNYANWCNVTSDSQVPMVKTITFSFAGYRFTAKEGQTWEEWLNEHPEYQRTTPTPEIYFDFMHDDAIRIYTPKHTSADSWSLSGAPDSYWVERTHVIVDGRDYQPIHWCCFDAGSQVLMADGTTKNIEDVCIGDMVMSLNEATGEFIAQPVTNTITKHNSDDLVYVNLSDGTQIGMRAYHPLLTTEGWKSLRPEMVETIADVGIVPMLEVGDTLVGYNNNVTIISIETRPAIDNYNTYNLGVANFHNYIVNGGVVHHAGCK